MDISSSFLNRIKRKRILVVGDLILDCSIKCKASGISAEIPIATYKELSIDYTLGGAANVALNLRRAGQDVSLCSVIGNDEHGRLARTKLMQNQVDESFIFVDDNRRTTVKRRYYTEQNIQVFRVDNEDDFDITADIEFNLMSKLSEVIEEYDLIVISDYLKGCLSKKLTSSIIKIAHDKNIEVLVDPKDPDYSKYKYCDYLKPNKKELSMMLKKTQLRDIDIIEGCKYICEQNHNRYIIVTLGADGIMLCDKDGLITKVDATQKHIIDVCGAGDTVAAYLAVALASKLSSEEAVALANNAAGVKVLKFGTSPVYIGELLTSKIIDTSFLPILKKSLVNTKIVFTNGCYDLLHVGHVQSLIKAKSMGDVLIVGINTDDSVKRLKGETRPIIKLESRMRMLEALACVDYIVPFDDDTPLDIVKQLIPNIIVKGADYKDKCVVGAEIVLENGGQVCFVDMLDGFSTTEIVKTIKYE